LINEIVLTVTLILQIYNGGTIGSATGFFYTNNDQIFLVTNKHVVEKVKINKNGNTEEVKLESLKLILHIDVKNTKKNKEYDIPLYKGKKKLWKTHPKYPKADIALIKLDKDVIGSSYLIKSWSKENFLPSNYPLHPGEDVFIMGYPKGFFDRINNLPIFRNAMIASVYGIYFSGNPLFLTDAELHAGMSGSPVITKPKQSWVDDKGNLDIMTGTTYYLLGIHSGTVKKDQTRGVDIKLGAAWYANLIQEISETF